VRARIPVTGHGVCVTSPVPLRYAGPNRLCPMAAELCPKPIAIRLRERHGRTRCPCPTESDTQPSKRHGNMEHKHSKPDLKPVLRARHSRRNPYRESDTRPLPIPILALSAILAHPFTLTGATMTVASRVAKGVFFGKLVAIHARCFLGVVLSAWHGGEKTFRSGEKTFYLVRDPAGAIPGE
jgi:hypothetical protein